MSNAIPGKPLTPDEKAEEEDQATETQDEPAETSPESDEDKGTEPAADYTKLEPDAKSWEHALQLSREREKLNKGRATQLEEELEDTKSRLDEIELQGLTEGEQYRIKAEKAEQRLAEIQQKLEVEELKKEYRGYLAQKETDFPKAVSFLKKQADKDIYPVQGQTPEEFNANFEAFAQDYEGSGSPTESKAAAVNPQYTPPEQVDISKLNSEELRKLLPVVER